jgi:taurine dioxygenase
MASLNVTPLQTDLPFGVRMSGVTRQTLESEAARQQIRDVFEDRGVIVFEGVEPTAEMQVLISEAIGPLKDHPVNTVRRYDRENMPGVITIATDPKNPKTTIVEIDGKPLMLWQPWHFDHTYNNELNRGGVLRADKTPPEGGATAFTDGIDIYKRMAPDLREKAESLGIIYTLDLYYERQKWGLPTNFRIIQSKGASVS